ncbi:hypothetical protein HDU84_008754 [Entophlyctis sp. JEL0112]|nr:hypothetical protein HDU84_008754 [Entophlyctis sp. JEL0112]
MCCLSLGNPKNYIIRGIMPPVENLRPVIAGQTTSPQIYRSANPSGSSEVISDLRIHTVIDLRSTREVRKDKHLAAFENGLAEAGARRHHVDLTLGMHMRVAKSLRMQDLAACLGYALTCQLKRAEIELIRRSPLGRSGGLEWLYLSFLENQERRKSELRHLFEILADAKAYPVLIHCSAGKDRTGLVVALLLRLAGVGDDDILDDYELSNKGLESMRTLIATETRRVGMSEELGECKREAMRKAMDWIDTNYGSVEVFLESIGVGRQTQAAVVANAFAGGDGERAT